MVSSPYRITTIILVTILAGCVPMGRASPPHQDRTEGVGKAVYEPMVVVPMPDLLGDHPVGRDMESLQARNTPIGDVLLALFRDSDINLIVEPSVQNIECTFDIKNSTVEEAFEALLESADLGYEWDGDYLRIRDRVKSTIYVDLMGSGGGESEEDSGGGEESTDVWSDLEGGLPSFVGDEAIVVINKTASTLHVEARPSELRRIREFINTTMKRANRQVSIEARILEVRLDDAYSLGVNWSLLPDLFHTSNTGLATGGGVLTQMAPSGGAALTFGVLDTGDFSLFVDALQEQGQVRVLSSPRVSTMNNKAATIEVLDQLPFITREVIDDEGVARTEYGVEFVDTGVSLNVRPMIGEDGLMTVSVTPTVKEQTGTVVTPDGFIEVPVISERTATTLVRVSDGQAVALGGLRSTRKVETRQGVPFLMNIPLLGQLFSSTVQSRTEVELMILLSPRVLDDTWIREEVRRGEHRLVQLRRGFQWNPIGADGFRPEDYSGGSMQGESMAGQGPAVRIPESTPTKLPDGAGLTVTRMGLASHWLEQAQKELDAGGIRSSLDAIENAISLEPGNVEALVAAGILLARQGNAPKARLLLDRAMAVSSRDVVTLTARGSLELVHGSPYSARRYLERAHEISASTATAANLGAALLTLGESERARELLRGAAGPDAPPELHANLAFAELEAGHVDKASESLRRALEAGADDRNPRIVALKKLVANAQAELARLEEAAKRNTNTGSR